MENETNLGFNQRWVETAEAELRSAKREWLVWICVFIPTAAAQCCISCFASRSRWSIGAEFALLFLFLLSFVKAALSASNLGDAKKFLRQYRDGLANENQLTR